jgi:hypothetical protein
MRHHTIRIAARCAHAANGRQCGRTTVVTHPYCWYHTRTELGLEVRRSTIAGAGLGLFAVRPFLPGERIAQYDGERLSADEYQERYEGQALGTFGIELDHNVVLDARRTDSGVARYACDYHGSGGKANAEFVAVLNKRGGEVWIIATKSIGVGDEIFVDYGDEMHDAMGVKPTTSER